MNILNNEPMAQKELFKDLQRGREEKLMRDLKLNEWNRPERSLQNKWGKQKKLKRMSVNTGRADPFWLPEKKHSDEKSEGMSE